MKQQREAEEKPTLQAFVEEVGQFVDAFLTKAGGAGNSARQENERIVHARDGFAKRRQAFSPSNRESVLWASNLMKKV